MKKSSNLKAFSLIELSVVILIIGVLVLGVTQGSRMMRQAKLTSARSLTTSSPVASIDGLDLWLEATSEKSFKSSEAVNTAIGSDGTLTNWYDINPQTTSPNNTSQTNSDKKPRYIANAINGLPAVNFDGTDDYLVSSGILSGLSGVTVFAVLKPSSFSGPRTIVRGGTINSSKEGSLAFALTKSGSKAGCVRFVHNGSWTGSWTPSGPLFSDSDSVVCSMRYNGTNLQGWTNGIADTKDLVSDSLSVTENTLIGIDPALGATFKGGMGEIIIFNRGLNETERQSVESYLSQKWGVVIP